MPAYVLCTPPSAVGANKLHLDLFNAAGSGKALDVWGIWAYPKLDAAVVGVVAVNLHLCRTSTAGTGGTAAQRNSATVDQAGGNFARFDDTEADLPAQVTARFNPGGGAAVARWLFPLPPLMPEETNPAGYLSAATNLLPRAGRDDDHCTRLLVHEGSGLLVRQGAVASVGSVSLVIGFNTL
jgi:hypothetical protein